MPDKAPDYTLIVNQRSEKIRHLQAESGARLGFSDALEVDFAHYRSSQFLQREKTLLILGMCLYLMFIWSDIVPLPEQYGIWIAAGRLAIFCLMAVSLITALQIDSRLIDKYAVHVVSFFMVLAGAHVCISAVFLPHPDDYIYILGIIPTFLAIIAILRYHFILCTVALLSTLSLCCLVLFVVPENRDMMTQVNSIDTFITSFPLLFFFFLFSIAVTGMYLAFAFEKMMRENWLEQRISKFEADNMTDLTTRLRELTRKDELTQIANRRHFYEKLIEEIKRSQREKMSLSLLMLDLDHFKKYNDNYGHQAGDLCLQKVASCLEYQCHRSGDLVARYGGEEFIILLPNTDNDGAQFMADSLKIAIEMLKISHDKSPFGYVTASLGVTTVLPDGDTAAKDIVRQADEALYQAKANGRNRYECYDATLN